MLYVKSNFKPCLIGQADPDRDFKQERLRLFMTAADQDEEVIGS